MVRRSGGQTLIGTPPRATRLLQVVHHQPARRRRTLSTGFETHTTVPTLILRLEYGDKNFLVELNHPAVVIFASGIRPGELRWKIL